MQLIGSPPTDHARQSELRGWLLAESAKELEAIRLDRARAERGENVGYDLHEAEQDVLTVRYKLLSHPGIEGIRDYFEDGHE